MSDTSNQQPYVEDYDSVISEVVPLTRRTTVRHKSNLSQSISAEASNMDGISDSGYSSHSANTPSNDTEDNAPPQKSHTPAPVNRKESMKRASTPGTGGGFQRPPSKSFSRTASPAMPRNIPGARPRSSTTGGADECDCSDCGKKGPAKASPSSPSRLSAEHWPTSGHAHHGSYGHSAYGQSPNQYPSYSYPYDYPEYAGDPPMTKASKRNSMPPPPRPSSTFSGTTTSSYASGYNNGTYFTPPAPSPGPQPPAPSQTCPPSSGYSPYAPPPLNTSLPPTSSYAIPSPAPYTSYDYSSSYTAPSPSAYTHDPYAMPPPPPVNRRNSMRAQATTNATYDDYPAAYLAPPRRSSRPPSWTSSQFAEAAHRSMSVPPQESTFEPPPSRRNKTPAPDRVRRRDSTHSRDHRLGPSALSRAMESCAIADDEPLPPSSSSRHARSQSAHHPNMQDYYTYTYPTALARRPKEGSESGSEGSEEGGRRRSGGRGHQRGAESMDMAGTMRYVTQRQQQVHAQLTGAYAGVSYGSGGERTRRGSGTSGGPPAPEWAYERGGGVGVYARRATMGGV